MRRLPLHIEPLERRLVPNQFDLAPIRRDDSVIQLLNAVNAFGGPAGDGALEYVESSSGLEPPRMEGGRTEIEFGDVNYDGHVDIVSIGDHGSPFINSDQHGIMVWFGDGTGNWRVVMTGRFGYGGVALGDVNWDGLLDVGYGMHHNYSQGDDLGDQLLEVALGNGSGSLWTPWDDGLATSGETYGMFETDFADADNDGDLDLGAVSFGCCNGLRVYLNQGNGAWTPSFSVPGGNTRNNFSFGDVNGDGNADFASGHQRGTVYLGDGTGAFRLADGNLPPIGTIGRVGTALGDVNGDGRDELSFVNAGRGLSVWTWMSEGIWTDVSGALPATGQFEATQIADMNLDGHGDLVAHQRGTTTVYAGDGAGNWRQLAGLNWPVETTGISALRAGADLDHNGYPDLGIIASERTGLFSDRNRFRVYLESSVATELAVYPKSPRGGETFVAGSTHFLDWHAALPPGTQNAAMTIELSLSGANGPWKPLAKNLPNNGRFQWWVPSDILASTQCYLRYTLRTDSGEAVAVTPGAFTIR
jgi:hypothetical protein